MISAAIASSSAGAGILRSPPYLLPWRLPSTSSSVVLRSPPVSSRSLVAHRRQISPFLTQCINHNNGEAEAVNGNPVDTCINNNNGNVEGVNGSPADACINNNGNVNGLSGHPANTGNKNKGNSKGISGDPAGTRVDNNGLAFEYGDPTGSIVILDEIQSTLDSLESHGALIGRLAHRVQSDEHFRAGFALAFLILIAIGLFLGPPVTRVVTTLLARGYTAFDERAVPVYLFLGRFGMALIWCTIPFRGWKWVLELARHHFFCTCMYLLGAGGMLYGSLAMSTRDLLARLDAVGERRSQIKKVG